MVQAMVSTMVHAILQAMEHAIKHVKKHAIGLTNELTLNTFVNRLYSTQLQKAVPNHPPPPGISLTTSFHHHRSVYTTATAHQFH